MGGMTRGGSGNDPRHTFEQKNIEGCPSTGAVPPISRQDYYDDICD